MSEPTYLIRVTHDPTEETLPWEARVCRLADETEAVVRWGSTEQEAVKAAQRWIRAAYAEPQPGRDLYAAENGELLVGESVRVLRQPS